MKKTPDLLPVLKEVGVVDSGGQGLVFVLQAFYESLSGKVAENDLVKPDNAQIDEMINAKHHQSAQGKLDPNDIKYGYCTQMMVRIGRGKQVTQNLTTTPSITTWPSWVTACWSLMTMRLSRFTFILNSQARYFLGGSSLVICRRSRLTICVGSKKRSWKRRRRADTA